VTTTSAKAKASQRRGEALEVYVLARLRGMGCMVERIATPVRMVRGRPMRTAKVFADIIGLNQDGRGLLVECKNYGRKPRPSDFRPHQRDTLTEWARRGGVAAVAWIEDGAFKLYPAEYILGKKTKKQTAEHADEYHPTTQIVRKK
jgi:Holliday junction resolvase